MRIKSCACKNEFEPKRVQRKRTKGWKMPPNTVYVGRPTKWGNPFRVGYTSPFDNTRLMTLESVIVEYERWLRQQLAKDPRFLEPLRGKDLACWCPVDKPCHADVLLKFLRNNP